MNPIYHGHFVNALYVGPLLLGNSQWLPLDVLLQLEDCTEHINSINAVLLRWMYEVYIFSPDPLE